MNSKHTPGPWEIEYNNADEASGGQWYTVGPARVLFPYNADAGVAIRALANARLIAAAPELLEVARRTAAAHDEGTPLGQLARAALAKAEG